MGPGGFSVGVDFMPRSLRRCQPGQVPRDSLNPVFRGTPGGHEKHKWAGLHRKLGSPTAAPTACSYCALLCGENECVGFSECEFGVLGGHIHERQAERSGGRRLGFSQRELPHQSLILDPMRLVRLRSHPSPAVVFILLVVPFEPNSLALSFEGQDMGRDPIQEPAVV